jgi:ribosomal protein S18 acetylase RimI-like enzyme
MTTLRASTNSRADAEKAQKKIQINSATIEDVDLMVGLHYKCFSEKDHIAMRFGRPFILAMYRWFVTSPETFALIARQGDSLIGFSTVSDQFYDAPMLRACWQEALIGLILHPWLAFHPELLRRLVQLLLSRSKDSPVIKIAQIAFIGVDPQVQGAGVGKALVFASIRTCRERGISTIVVGIKRQNRRSIKVHESVGFIEAPELGTKRFVYLRLDLDKDDPSS